MLGLLISLSAIGLLAGATPMRCQGPIAKRPFRGCRKRVCGFMGHCRYHGFQPGRRIMAVFGGESLLRRRICSKCGSATVFGRVLGTGKPFIGCSGYPTCKNPCWLAN
jgi:hypothetical protein